MHRYIKYFLLWILSAICFNATGQQFDTELRYTDSTGKSVLIQSSFPKGMAPLDSTGKPGYIDATGKYFAYVVFWTRVTNETNTPLELTINFPVNFPEPYSYLKLFLPSDSMSLKKDPMMNYGLKSLKTFLDDNFNKQALLKRIIDPKGDYSFYIAVLSSKLGNAIRARFILKGHDLYYNIKGFGPELASELIPCGQIIFK